MVWVFFLYNIHQAKLSVSESQVFLHTFSAPLLSLWLSFQIKCFQAFFLVSEPTSGTLWLVLFPFQRQRQSSMLGKSQLWSWGGCLAFISLNHDVFITTFRLQKAFPEWRTLSESPCYSKHHKSWRTNSCTSKAMPWQYSVGTEDKKALVAFYLENQPQRCLKAIQRFLLWTTSQSKIKFLKIPSNKQTATTKKPQKTSPKSPIQR